VKKDGVKTGELPNNNLYMFRVFFFSKLANQSQSSWTDGDTDRTPYVPEKIGFTDDSYNDTGSKYNVQFSKRAKFVLHPKLTCTKSAIHNII
jgi:hypothetical protein